MQDESFSLTGVARALWVQKRIEKRIAKKSLLAVLQDTKSFNDRCIGNTQIQDKRAAQIIRAFEHARLLRSAADRCLSRSIALAVSLAALGVQARVVIGVQLPPFTAHCWAQYDDVVLNDSAEEVRRFQPILVI